MLVACWEAFVEDLAKSSFEFLINHATDHQAFPAKVLTRASKVLREAQDERDVWKLADDGWKQVLTSYKDQLIEEHIGKFNTPNPINVDALFDSLVGCSNLSSNWYWQKMSPEQAKKKLKSLTVLRGSIAHKVSASKLVQKTHLTKSVTHIERLATISSNTLRNHIHNRVNKYAWDEVPVTE